jgi:hypothetical protein
VLHIQQPPHILQTSNEAEDDTGSEAGSVFTNLEGGVVTEERLLDESLGRPKRKLVPVVDVKVGKRSKVGTADVIFYDADSEVEAEPETEVQVGTEVDPLAEQPPVNVVESQDESDVPNDPTLPAPLLSEEIAMDLGESAALEDPIDTETTYSPLLGPRPDDILFDLSDDGEEGGEEGDASESEVWAELEDQEMTQAFTPAGMLGDYEMSDDEEEDGGMDEDEDVGTEAIMAAILSDPLDSGLADEEGDPLETIQVLNGVDSEDRIVAGPESEEAAINGDVDMAGAEDDGLVKADTVKDVIDDLTSDSEVVTAAAEPLLNGSMTLQPKSALEDGQCGGQDASGQTTDQVDTAAAVVDEIDTAPTVEVESTLVEDQSSAVESEVQAAVPSPKKQGPEATEPVDAVSQEGDGGDTPSAAAEGTLLADSA